MIGQENCMNGFPYKAALRKLFGARGFAPDSNCFGMDFSQVPKNELFCQPPSLEEKR
jgi:hypothetical protein